MQWPGFVEKALELGLRASVSIPLFAGSGAAVAVLNLHSTDHAAMAPLIAGVWAIYDPERPLPKAENPQPLDDGAEELLVGFAAAVAVRHAIQRGLQALMQRHRYSRRDAYLDLCTHAAQQRVSLTVVAKAALVGSVKLTADLGC